MKLYLYDHCPFCVRVEMVAHYKQLPIENVYLLNDDEATCFKLVNAKQVPILQLDDDSCMPESLDIAHKLDTLGAADKRIVNLGIHEAINQHMAAANMAMNCLRFPRNVMIGLPEFATESARRYFQSKKETSIARSFAQALQETPEHIRTAENALNTLPALPDAHQHGQLSWDDVMVYPGLRNLSIVKGLNFPSHVRHYVQSIALLTQTHTFFDRAV